jgi:hypothetical protein
MAQKKIKIYSYKVYTMLLLLNNRIALYQDFRNIALSLDMTRGRYAIDCSLVIHIQILFWGLKIYFPKVRRHKIKNQTFGTVNEAFKALYVDKEIKDTTKTK